jgi:DNA-binding transcriptional regulator YiaG
LNVNVILKDFMNVKNIRKSTGLNQFDFWQRVFVTQSGGCRYEQGRRVPMSVQTLIIMAYGAPLTARKVLADLRK